jgi:probable rRNA maturation factor
MERLAWLRLPGLAWAFGSRGLQVLAGGHRPSCFLRKAIYTGIAQKNLGCMVTLKKRVPGLEVALMERFVRRACRAAKLAGAVDVLITSDREMRMLNQRYRGKDSATDVLSFPAVGGLPGKLAGDLAISADIASANAKDFGHGVGEEINVLILHGVLHLAGYDHERDSGQMARKEKRLRAELGLPMNLIARASSGARGRK